MGISDKTRKLLWGRSGSRCAFCRQELCVDSTPLDGESIVGDECHIHSKETNGPRFVSPQPFDDMDCYPNLILLCRVHHKQVDDQQNTYASAVLIKMKNEHECWVTQTLNERVENSTAAMLPYQKMLADHGQRDLVLTKLVVQYATLRRTSVDWGKRTGAKSTDEPAMLDDLLSTLRSQLPEVEVKKDLPGQPLILNIGSNMFKVIFAVPMRIPPKITFTKLPEGVTSEIVEESTFGFVVLFKPLSSTVTKIYDFMADADF